ncbi:MAG: hypothetical protein Dasosvirus22_2 [Dasosvirus sp.]|uniref:Uncharacterized protein n=1 Tax=Dasosvirus sp. TaxID=2487764 RepID=A0A3G4ZW41_9VIRU|nr:MAG: hypothetical protein Dasosvirus22_2 [Dasosvirus sp.]
MSTPIPKENQDSVLTPLIQDTKEQDKIKAPENEKQFRQYKEIVLLLNEEFGSPACPSCGIRFCVPFEYCIGDQKLRCSENCERRSSRFCIICKGDISDGRVRYGATDNSCQKHVELAGFLEMVFKKKRKNAESVLADLIKKVKSCDLV